MYEIETISGARYIVHNGRLTRTCVADPYLPPEYQFPIFDSVPFVNVTAPTVGERWRYRTGVTGLSVTSPVFRIYRNEEVRAA